MFRSKRITALFVSAKILATLAALIPLFGGCLIFEDSRAYREPNPGPGGFPSMIPSAFIGMVIGVAIVLWAVPQLGFLAWVWRERAWAMFTSASLCIVQGAVPLVILIGTRGHDGGATVWMVCYVSISLAAGFTLMAAGALLTMDKPQPPRPPPYY